MLLPEASVKSDAGHTGGGRGEEEEEEMFDADILFARRARLQTVPFNLSSRKKRSWSYSGRHASRIRELRSVRVVTTSQRVTTK